MARALWGDDADAHVLVTRAKAGDAAAVAALEQIGVYVGAAIGSFVNTFDPDVLVIGGGFGAAAGDLLLGPALASARREAIQPADERLTIVEAQLGDEAGLIGAALVGFEALDGER
jgi:glucokinase